MAHVPSAVPSHGKTALGHYQIFARFKARVDAENGNPFLQSPAWQDIHKVVTPSILNRPWRHGIVLPSRRVNELYTVNRVEVSPNPYDIRRGVSNPRNNERVRAAHHSSIGGLNR